MGTIMEYDSEGGLGSPVQTKLSNSSSTLLPLLLQHLELQIPGGPGIPHRIEQRRRPTVSSVSVNKFVAFSF